MMWFRDQVFGGVPEAQIPASTKPSAAKLLGRNVPNFNRDIWNAVARHGVFAGNMAKFTQNPAIIAELFKTAGTTLVEASPSVSIWGIGLEESDPRAADRATWRGTNWLGQTVTEVRDTILKAGNAL